MKLAVSNIAWDDADEPAVLSLLRHQGICGIEVAPTRFWPDWSGATPSAARAARRRLADEAFEVPSLQAIFYARPECQLFGDRSAFIDHVRRVADLAAEMGAKVLVFGAPKNRDPGTLTPDIAFTQAVEVLRQCGADCAARGVKLCIEPNPQAYGCNFVTDSRAGLALVRAVGSPGFGLHLDTGGLKLAGQNSALAVAEVRGDLAHLHVSEPGLAPILPASIDHAAVGGALRRTGYDGWCAIEMRRTTNPVADLTRSIEHARHCYRDRLRLATPAAASMEAVA